MFRRPPMRVWELIAYLQRMDQEKEVLVGDHDDWFYEPVLVKQARVCEGKIVDDDCEDHGSCDVVVIMSS